ncbi:hypothetical protein F5887DRAFT_1202144 [Amanita rubescens]|nr:hypothetical protein F5887DRAFT_1202144 [Amanita rubescens]
MSFTSYLPLPTALGAYWLSGSRNRERRTINKRHLRVLLVVVIVGVTVWYLQIPRILLDKWTIPFYEEYRNQEDHLPHYSNEAPYPNGRHAKYILFGTHQQGVGWGNVMQEIIMNAFLAYSAKRSFVFYDHSWNAPNGIATYYDDRRIPSSIPLSAILSGNELGPLAIPMPLTSPGYLGKPLSRNLSQCDYLLKEYLAEDLNGATLLQKLKIWIDKLGSIEDRCNFGSKEVLNLWPALSQSPIIKHFGWSSLVYEAYDANRHLFEYKSPKMTLEHSGEITSFPFPRIDGLLALHIRRGDFAGHCDELANVSQIVEKVSSVRKKVTGLKRIYIMTNGKTEWVNELILALQTAEKWEAMSSTTGDLSLTWEQKYISQALDMYVAQRAEAFIGNGGATSQIQPFSGSTAGTRAKRRGGTLTARERWPGDHMPREYHPRSFEVLCPLLSGLNELRSGSDDHPAPGIPAVLVG